MGGVELTMPSPPPRKQCWYCGKAAARGHMYCATCLRRIERTGCVDLNEYPTQQDADRTIGMTAEQMLAALHEQIMPTVNNWLQVGSIRAALDGATGIEVF